jgi:hypothetical protein
MDAAALVPVLNPQGETVEIAQADLPAALQVHGFQPLPPDQFAAWEAAQQFKGPGQALIAGGESALGTATFGLGPKALDVLGLDPEASQLARKEAHPFASTVGGVLGVAVPIAGEAGAFGKAAQIAAKVTAPSAFARAGKVATGAVEGLGLAGAAGRIAPAVAGAMTEGALYGAEDAFERHLLGDPKMTFEKAAAQVGLSALIPGGLVGIGKGLGEAFRPLADKLIAKGEAKALQKAWEEAASDRASLQGATGSAAANAYRQVERIELMLGNKALPETERAAMLAFKESPEYAELLSKASASVSRDAPEAAAKLAGAQGTLAEFEAGVGSQVAERASALQEPARLGQLVNERIVQRYGSRAAIGWVLGALTGAGGPIGTLGGISYGYMKDVIKRILKDPTMYSTVGGLLKNPVTTLSAMLGLARLSHATDEAIAAGVGGIFRSGAASGAASVAGGAASRLLDPRTYIHVASNLRGYDSSPDRLASDLAGGVGGIQAHAPATATEASSLATRGLAHLAGNLPPEGDRKPLDPPRQPSSTELAEFGRRVEIAEDPVRVLDHVRNGTLLPQHVETLDHVYPSLANEMRVKVMEQLGTEMARGTEIPYRTRLSLSLFLGADLESSTTPGHILANQLAILAPQGQPGGLGSGGSGKLTLSERMQTETQSSAARGA